jgi:hypothetical protein
MWRFNLWNWGSSHWLRAPDGEGAGGAAGDGTGSGDGTGNGAGDAGDGAGAGDGIGGDGAGDDGKGKLGPDGKPIVRGIMDLGDDKGGDDKGKPPAGKAPAGTPPEFLNADGTLNGEAALKAARDLRVELSKKPGKPPEKADDYKIELTSQKLKDAGVKELDPNDPIIPFWRNVAHKYGLSQAVFNGITNDMMEQAFEDGELGVDPVEIVKKEFEKLGADGQAIKDTIKGWGSKLVADGVLSKEEHQEFLYMAGTAQGAQIMMKLRTLAGEAPIPRVNAGEVGGVSPQAAHAMMGEKFPAGHPNAGKMKYGIDLEHTRKVDEAFAKAFPGEGQGTSMPGLNNVSA